MSYHYPWWGYIRDLIRRYPGAAGKELSGVALKGQNAVKAAIEETERMNGGEERMKLIRMVHFDRTHTLDGAAQEIPCNRATAARWQRKFFEDVARARGILD